ncbi:hypothetical protein CUMW_281250, partial [Citrus unshiu]
HSENPSIEPISKEHDHDDDEEELLLSQLQKAQLCNSFDVDQYQGFWCPYDFFPTHSPFASLPLSILTSNCGIVYVRTNPLDQFITDWQFIPRLRDLEPSRIDEAFERACCGIQNPKRDLTFCVKRLADFLGCSFSEGEEANGVIGEISKLCSFDNIKGLEATKFGKQPDGTRNFSLL